MQDSNQNELHPELLGLSALNFGRRSVSAPRIQMMGSQLNQTLCIKDSTPRTTFTGYEQEFGKYTFNIKFEVDSLIIKVIKKYKQRLGEDSIDFNPLNVVVYENVKTKEIDILYIPTFHSFHSYLGFEYKPTEAVNQVSAGNYIPAGTIIMDSPSKKENGEYQYGIELNTALVTMPYVSEDGIGICRDVFDKLEIKTYETRTIEFGAKYYPINLLGDNNIYKAFPDIGEMLREDGLLIALRRYNTLMSPVEQSIYDLRKVDTAFDKLCYVDGPGGKVIDIKIHYNGYYDSQIPTEVISQCRKYYNATKSYHQEIIDLYNQLNHQRGKNLKISPAFHRLVTESIAILACEQQRIRQEFKQVPTDTWRIEFTIEYSKKPTYGWKLTDTHSSKGVIVKVLEPHEMPVDQEGNRADVVMDPLSKNNRQNVASLYELYFNAASRTTFNNIKKILNILNNNTDLNNINKELFEKAFNYLLGYYKIISPQLYTAYINAQYQDKLEHLQYLFSLGTVRNYIPPNSEIDFMTVVNELEKNYPPLYGPVTFTDLKGNKTTTKSPVRIGSLYFILLEKIADDYSAVASGHRSNFGVLSPISKTTRDTKPTREQGVKAWGESEIRSVINIAGGEAGREILDRNNSIEAHREMCETILKAPQPTNIKNLIDRKKVPYGNSKPLMLLKHIAECSGFEIAYKPGRKVIK